MTTFSDSPILFGHRGASAEAPENTMLAFERAIERGATGLEMDVHLTRDGVVVVHHDDTPVRTAGHKRAVRACLWDDVRRWDVGAWFMDDDGAFPFRGGDCRVPRFADVVSAFDDVAINVDLKQPGIAAAVITTLRRLGAESRVLLTSFDRATIADIRARGYAGPTGLCRDEVIGLLAMPRALRKFRPVAGDAVQIPTGFGPVALDSRGLIDKWHALGLRVDYWTINDPAQADALLAAGADGIMTDDPAAIAPVFRRRGVLD